jgi:hypothetical protein
LESSVAFIIYAKRLEFVPDPERHTVAVVRRMDRSFELLGAVDAVIDEDWDSGIARLKDLVRAYAGTFVDVRDGKVLISDFKLFFCRGRVKIAAQTNGLLYGVVETPGVVGSDCKL